MATEVQNPDEELQRLRVTNKELLQAKHTLKAKVDELESQLAEHVSTIATLQEQVKTEKQAVYDSIVGAPLRRLAAELSDVPEIFLAEFEKRYSVEAGKDGSLAVLTKSDSKPAVGKDGKPVSFTANSLWQFLTGGAANYGKGNDAKLFATLTRWQGPSGTGAGGHGTGANSGVEEKKSKAPKLPTGMLGLH